MNSCRVCLTNSCDKDISELESEDDGMCKNYVEILQFCLDIEVLQYSNITTKLCNLCFKKILLFHKFKHLAQSSDVYLRTVVVSVSYVNNEVYLRDDIKAETESLDSTAFCDAVEKGDVLLRDSFEEYRSDDEFSSVIKELKHEHIGEETKNDEFFSVIKEIKLENVIDNIKTDVPYKPKKKKLKKIKKPKAVDAQLQICEECGKTVKNLKQHMYKHRPLSARQRFQCKVCDKTYTSYSARYKHHKTKHLRIIQKCGICNKAVVNLKQHELLVHNADSLRFECVSCGRKFISQSALDVHLSIHTKDRPFQCDLCDKKYRTKVMMVQHRRQVHQKEKPHLCQFCSKSFFKKYHLQVHLRSHTKEKPHGCPDCGKHFACTTTLKNHRLTHNDVKTFNCTLCDMSFVRSGYLQAHMISHTKEKKHACKYCGVKFGRSDHRKRHENTVHERYLVAGKPGDNPIDKPGDNPNDNGKEQDR